jgi:hypothetical protein
MSYLSKKYIGLSIEGRPHLHKGNAQGWDFFLRNWDGVGLYLREIRLFFPEVDIDDTHLGRVADQFEAPAHSQLAHDG